MCIWELLASTQCLMYFPCSADKKAVFELKPFSFQGLEKLIYHFILTTVTTLIDGLRFCPLILLLKQEFAVLGLQQ